MWNIKCMIIPVTAGVVRKELQKMYKPLHQTLSSFTTKKSHTRNITHNTGSTAV